MFLLQCHAVLLWQLLAVTCRLEAMRAAQFSSRGATPHEEQALLKQAKALAAQQETAQATSGSRGKASRGRGRGRAAAITGPESPQPHAASKSTQPSQGTTFCAGLHNHAWLKVKKQLMLRLEKHGRPLVKAVFRCTCVVHVLHDSRCTSLLLGMFHMLHVAQ